MTEKEFQKLQENINNDLNLTKSNILEKSIEIPKLYTKYLNIYNKELRIFKEYSLLKDNTYGKLYHYYKFEGEFKLDKKTEIEPYIKSNEKYLKICYKLNNIEIYCKHLEKILESIKQMGYSIKNFIEYKKFLSGN